MATGHQFRAWLTLLVLGLWTVIFALLTYGALKGWRWVFWVFLLLLALAVIASIPGPNQTPVLVLFNLIAGLIAAVLFIASAVGLVRFGPWAMKKSSSEPDDHPPEPALQN